MPTQNDAYWAEFVLQVAADCTQLPLASMNWLALCTA